MRATFLLFAGAAMAAQSVQWSSLPLSFEPNTGQTSAEVRYLARGTAYSLYLGPGQAVLAGRGESTLKTTFLGANESARIAGETPQGSTSNYLIGNDPAKWRTSIANFGRVRYSGVYPGIDLVYYGKDGNLEYDWIVSPGADPRTIRMTFERSDRVRIDKAGDLVIRTGRNEYRHKKPVAYQEIAGRRVPVAGRWTLHGHEGSFSIGAYDPAKELVIDPPLIYSTYYGGNGIEWANAVAVDPAGNTYVTGGTASANLNVGLKGVEDAFVMKLNPSGARMFTTFFGGGGADEGKGIAIDAQANIYVTGNTGSLDFPLKNAPQAKIGGSGDAFLLKLDRGGSAIVYSTYIGGIANDFGNAVAVDSAGSAYVVGITFSADFPTHSAFQAAKGAQQDAFVAKINPAGSAWIYSTYLGGNAVDEGYAIAVDVAGNAYVTGYTDSTNFPLQSPIRSSNATSVDAFVTKINPAGSALVYSTYLGGSATDYGTAIAVDQSGSAYVTGIVTSDDFPLANPIFNKLASHAVDDVFVTKFNPAGSSLVYSTYLGGGSADDPYALALDPAGNVYIAGRTNSSDFPLKNAIQSVRTAFDMFVTEINSTGTALLFSTFLGGAGSEAARGIAVDTLGNIHMVGETTSTDFPLAHALQGSNGGGQQDGAIVLLGNTTPSTGPTITAVSDNLVPGGPIVPGGWFYVKGTDLADTTRIWDTADFADSTTLPTDLSGTDVYVNGVPVPVYFISPGQVNAQAPTNLGSTATVQVFHDGLGSNTLTVQTATISPSIYNYQVGGKSYAAALFLDYALMGDPAVVPGTRKAKVGDVIQLYAAGLASSSEGAVPVPVPITGVTVTIGTTHAPVSFAGLVAAGQFQVNFTVPQLPDGEYSITVSVSGKTSPANVLFEIGQ